MKRGEVWWVEFDPSVGSEIRKTRPAVIVSNDAVNRNNVSTKARQSQLIWAENAR